MTVIRPEGPSDKAEVERLVAAAFGPGRRAKSAYRLREGVKPLMPLCHVAEDGATVVGTVRYWPVAISAVPAVMLGPIAVVPSLQGKGIALALMQTSLEVARRLGHRIVILVGDEPYYARAGFARVVPAGRITMPGPVDLGRLLALELVPGALEGVAGEVCRPWLDDPVSATGTPLAALAAPAKHKTADHK